MGLFISIFFLAAPQPRNFLGFSRPILGFFPDSRIWKKMKKDEKTVTNLTQVEMILHKPFSRLWKYLLLFHIGPLPVTPTQLSFEFQATNLPWS